MTSYLFNRLYLSSKHIIIW